MREKTRKLTVYIAMSLDGFIAKPGDDLSFLTRVEKEGEDYGYSSFYARIDTVIMGRKTYDWVYSMTGEMPHPDKKLFVCTRQADLQKEDTEFRFLKNNYNLTTRELEIIHYLAQGLDNQQISEKLYLSYFTVKTHRKNIYMKLGVSNIVELTTFAKENLL